jgi:hypothetical protein
VPAAVTAAAGAVALLLLPAVVAALAAAALAAVTPAVVSVVVADSDACQSAIACFSSTSSRSCASYVVRVHRISNSVCSRAQLARARDVPHYSISKQT